MSVYSRLKRRTEHNPPPAKLDLIGEEVLPDGEVRLTVGGSKQQHSSTWWSGHTTAVALTHIKEGQNHGVDRPVGPPRRARSNRRGVLPSLIPPAMHLHGTGSGRSAMWPYGVFCGGTRRVSLQTAKHVAGA
jgi:hypothetical protein